MNEHPLPDPLAELRAANAAAAANGDHSCVFDSDDDPSIPEGSWCGGCACHLAAPCDHHLRHLPEEEAADLALALRLTGRWTR